MGNRGGRERATLRTAAEARASSSWLPARSQLAAGFALIAILVFVAYSPALRGEFLWDDDKYVSDNSLLTAPDGLQRIWLSTDQPSQYVPLVYTSFRIEHAVWGLDTAGYHATNLVLHILNALLLWLVLLRLEIPGAWLAAAVFALHPVQVESVAWIAERKNVLMAFFLGLASLAWISFVERSRDERPARGAYAASAVLFVLALLSKATACTFPAAQVLILWLRRERLDRRRWAQIAPFALLALAMGLLTMWFERHVQNTRPDLLPLGVVDRLLVASRAIWFYIGKLLWPASLTFSYPMWRIDSADAIAWLWVLLCAAATGALWLGRARIGRGPFAAIAFFVATLLPTSGIILLWTFAYSYVADHYQYVACIGPIALVSAFGALAIRRLGRAGTVTGAAVAACLLAGLAALTWSQAHAYQGPEALWRDTLEKNPGSWMAHNNLGTLLRAQGKVDEAILHYRLASEIEGGIPGPRSFSFYNLGNALGQKGDFAEAERAYRRALDLKPDDARTMNNLANVLLAAGRPEDAAKWYRLVLEEFPSWAPARVSLAEALRRTGAPDEALEQARAAIAADPASADAHRLEGQLLAARGRAKEAAASFRESLRLAPDGVDALVGLARALLSEELGSDRSPSEAVALAERADALTGKREPRVLVVLAVAYAAAGRQADAAAAAERGAAVAPESSPIGAELRRLASLYRQAR